MGIKKPWIINLDGPEGNAHYLLDLASQAAQLLGKNGAEICARMMSSDYTNLVKVFKTEFGQYFQLVGELYLPKGSQND